jgi:hypothetical protein
VNEHEFHASSAILEDCRKLIATGKAQRWDVIKWAVTINVGLATASIALRDHPNAGSRLFWFALGVAFIAGVLVAHYNNRMKNTRNESVKTEKYLLRNDVDFAAITGRPPQCVGFFYDWQRLQRWEALLSRSRSRWVSSSTSQDCRRRLHASPRNVWGDQD